jgi:glycerol-3-phosphate O-acyltransferase
MWDGTGGKRQLMSDFWRKLGTDTTLPFWAVAVLAVLSALAILDRLLLPPVRWAIQRRANLAIDKLNTQLRLKIQPFKMTRRRQLIDQLLHDPDLLTAVDAHAQETGEPREVVMARVRRYASEMVPSFSAYTYFKIGTRLARKISTSLYRVRLGAVHTHALESIPPNASVVFVINHRSNMDYVLVTYVAAASSALSYAVGEWAQVWGLRNLISSMGAYFIRRNSRDPLYRKVLARYVDMATKAGVVQAIFPEGGLSRTGTLQPAKLGLLAYMVSGFDPQGQRDIVFIPVGLNYDRVLEDRMLLSASGTPSGETPRFGFNLGVFLRYMARRTWQRLTGTWHRYGYACVSFGKPISLKAILAPRGVDLRALAPDERHAEIAVIGQRLMVAVGEVVPALPVPLVATAILDALAQRLTLFELKGRVFELITAFEQAGAYVHIPRKDRDYAIDAGLRILVERGLVHEVDGAFSANPDDLEVLRYYARSLAHLRPATALLKQALAA